jgi:hypothetical protein
MKKEIEWYEVIVALAHPPPLKLLFTCHPLKRDIGNEVLKISKHHEADEHKMERFMQTMELLSHMDKADSAGAIRLCGVQVGSVTITRHTRKLIDNNGVHK